MSDLIKLGALWIKKDKRGRSYLTGRFSASTRLMIFKNEYKTSDNQPDYEMYLAPIDPPEGAQPRQTTDDFLDEGASAPAPARSAPFRRETPTDDDGDDEQDAPDTRRPQPARTSAPAPAASPRQPARAVQNGSASAPAPAARPSRNAPPPPADDDDLDDPFDS